MKMEVILHHIIIWRKGFKFFRNIVFSNVGQGGSYIKGLDNYSY